MELTFLGSSNAFASEGRYWSSFIVDRKFQFDAPPTLVPHLKQLGVDLPEIEVIFLSHHHADHFVGLPFLYLEYQYMTPRSKDLYVVGPPGVESWMEDFATRCYPNVTSDAGYRRIYVDACPGRQITAGPVTFTAFPMNHVTQTMQAMGYRVSINGKTVAYTGDTMFCEEIFQLGEGADVLVIDCTYTEGEAGPEHMGLNDAREIRRRLPQDTTIILTHTNSEPDTSGMHNVLAARDLKTYKFD
jgi:ribonuclease BN (tRNA processing enzyme)